MGTTKNEWIKTSEKLPPLEGTILLYVNDENPYIITGWAEQGAYGDDFHFTNGDDDLTEFVTHWQPLPEPPKGE